MFVLSDGLFPCQTKYCYNIYVFCFIIWEFILSPSDYLLIFVVMVTRRERQSGDYVMREEEDGEIMQKAPDVSLRGESVEVATMELPASPNIGRSEGKK